MQSHRTACRSLAIGLAAAAAVCAACSRDDPHSLPEPVCSERLYQAFEEAIPTGDGQGHGPDVGSDEWKSVIEFKLAIRDRPDVPSRDGDAWCGYVDEIIRSRGSSAPRR